MISFRESTLEMYCKAIALRWFNIGPISSELNGNRSKTSSIKCICGHVCKIAVQGIMLKYGGDTTAKGVEKAARCSLCTGKNIISIQIINVGNSELAINKK